MNSGLRGESANHLIHAKETLVCLVLILSPLTMGWRRRCGSAVSLSEFSGPRMEMWGEGMIPQGAVWQLGEPQLYDHDLQSS